MSPNGPGDRGSGRAPSADPPLRSSLVLTRRRRATAWTIGLASVALAAGVTVGAGMTTGGPAAAEGRGAGEIEAELERAAEILNLYREATGLPPVSIDLGLSTGAHNHSCWMARTDRLEHYREGASTGDAGAMSNIAVARSQLYSDKRFVELWLTGPYHAISMLRWGLTTIGYGTCNVDNGTWRRAATMDVVNGYERRRTEAPVMFPPPNFTTDLYRFLTEDPNPLENCGLEAAGLPVFVMLPEPPRASTTGSLTGPDGDVETCLITARNDVTDGRAVLQFDNAVLLVPTEPLDEGRWDVSIDSGHRQIAWTFYVGEEPRNGPPPPALAVPSAMPATAPVGEPGRLVTTAVTRTLDTRIMSQPPQLQPGREYRVPVGTAPGAGGGDATAVALTLTAAGHTEPGWAAVYPCAAGYNGTSTINFVPGAVAANSTIVPLVPDAGPATGPVPTELCARVSALTDLIVDVSAWFVTGSAGAGFVADEQRLLDTRGPNRLPAGSTREVRVTDPGATAVALNITSLLSQADGYMTVWPCDQDRAETSVSQPAVGLVRATSTIVPVSADGTICIFTSVETHVIIDRQGVFLRDEGASFVPLLPVRAVDTRVGPHPWSDVARRTTGSGDVEREVRWDLPGLPTGTTALALNVTSVGGSRAGWMAASGCERYGGQSTLNFTEEMAVPNLAIVDATGGRSCVRVDGFSHLIADVSGAFVDRA